MKKAFIFFLILAVFSGVVFFIGFTPMKVEPGEFGVVISKTDGVNDAPILNGDRSWNWQFLLPTNTKIERFSIKPVNITKTVSGELPSGSLYTALFNSSGKFDYKFTFSISLSITTLYGLSFPGVHERSQGDTYDTGHETGEEHRLVACMVI